MGQDKSLDEFLGGSEEAGGVAEADDEPVPADDAGGEVGASDSGPEAIPTADWSPEGAACTTCGAVVERRWRQGEGMVCGECKEW